MLTGCEFISPDSSLSRVDGSCNIGIHPVYAKAVIAVDTCFNFTLMAIFFLQIRPADGFAACRPVLRTFARKTQDRSSSNRTSLHHDLRRMLVRNVVGSTLLLVVTAVNNILFLTQKFANESHACQLLCLCDGKCSISFNSNSNSADLPKVAAGMLITNWLSMHSASTETEGSRGFTGLTSTHSGCSGIKAFGGSCETGHDMIEKPSPIRRILSK
jgi:hypothetical protein